MANPFVRLAAALAFIASVAVLAAPLDALGACRRGSVSPPAAAPAALTAAETADLQFMREEEKLARDVYVVMYEAWMLPIFSNISQSEQRHMDALKGLLDKYGVADPAARTAPGVFVDPALQSLYDVLVTSGLASPSAAIAVGVLIEEKDIADLEAAMARTSRTDFLQVYGNLLEGSRHHLAAFQGGSR